MKILAVILMKPVSFRDVLRDKRVCKMSLRKYVPSKFRDSHGATGSAATPYKVVEDMVDIDSLDVHSKFVDVGCGKGRVIAALLNKKAKCKLVGIELNEEVADIAKTWSEPYDNVAIICGDAFKIDMGEYTDIFLARPFETELFKEYLQKLEKELKQETNIYFYVDQLLGNYLDNREGWHLQRRGISYFRKGFFMSMSPQRYSIFKFIPQDK